MNAIPWYRSPVIVSAVVGLISQTLVILGIGDAVSQDDIAKLVDGFFQLVALGAATWTIVARARSKVQPVALTKESAERKTESPAWVGVVSALLVAVCLSQLTACNSLAVSRAETNEQRAGALLGDFNMYQRASIHIGEDQSVPVSVRKGVLDAVIAAKPIADKGDEILRAYRMVRVQLSVGETTQDKARIAAANLERWIRDFTPLLKSLRTEVQKVQPITGGPQS